MTTSLLQTSGCHFPGPYTLELGTDGVDETLDIVPFGTSRPIASLHFWSDDGGAIPPHILATGKLLAASPELFDVVKRLMRVTNRLSIPMSDDSSHQACADAASLIARLEGRE